MTAPTITYRVRVRDLTGFRVTHWWSRASAAAQIPSSREEPSGDGQELDPVTEQDGDGSVHTVQIADAVIAGLAAIARCHVATL